MDLSFWKMCPSGNTTILISEPHIAPALHAPIANILMHPLHLQAEQVAYVDIEARPPRIDMMGGEFCGNACRCLAAMIATQRGKELCEGTLRSSGTNEPVPYRVTRDENGTIHAAIRMPNATMPAVSRVSIQGHTAPIVHLEGIDHLLLDEKTFPQSAYFQDATQGPVADLAVRAILGEYGLLDSVAAGCIWYDYNATTNQCTITPFVHVRETQSLYAETACGSGTLAVALYLAGMTQGQHGECAQNNEQAQNQGPKNVTLDVQQPSGMTIAATCTQNADSIEAWIGGHVTCIAKGVTTVTL